MPCSREITTPGAEKGHQIPSGASPSPARRGQGRHLTSARPTHSLSGLLRCSCASSWAPMLPYFLRKPRPTLTFDPACNSWIRILFLFQYLLLGSFCHSYSLGCCRSVARRILPFVNINDSLRFGSAIYKYLSYSIYTFFVIIFGHSGLCTFVFFA